MTGTVERLRATMLDKDNFPRMECERHLPVGLAREAADEIERLRNLVREARPVMEHREICESMADDGYGLTLRSLREWLNEARKYG